MKSLYFNNAFSKRPLPEVVDALRPYLREEFENPLTESDGAERARSVLNLARESVAALIGARPDEIFFVSSGTEANNWALKGITQAWEGRGKNHLIMSSIEHFSVYQTAQFLSRHGFDLTIVPVNVQGVLDPDALAAAIRPSTVLVSIQAASDEIGVIQDLQAIAGLKRRFSDVFFHTDAIQFVCYEDLDVGKTPFDLVSLNSNALYGPAGIAALYIHKGTRIVPLLHGGMQEEGMRPGLQSMALIAGFMKAAQINLQEKEKWKNHLSVLQQKLFAFFDGMEVPITGSRSCRLVDNIHGIADVDGEAVLTLLLEEGIRCSSGSTCYQYAQKESHVLEALGVTPAEARGALLFTLGMDQTLEDLPHFCDAFAKLLNHFRRLKPQGP